MRLPAGHFDFSAHQHVAQLQTKSRLQRAVLEIAAYIVAIALLGTAVFYLVNLVFHSFITAMY